MYGDKEAMGIAGEKVNAKTRKNGIYERYIKRSLDVVGSVIAIIVLSPVMFLTAVLVRVHYGKPVLFRQYRPGRNERIFQLYKFRTMNNKKDKQGKLLPDEERLTSFGRKLRAASLDELPELFNILKGDMSFVGPRPLLVSYLPYYTQEEKKRHNVRPGLSGLAQISGRNFLDWDRRLRKDVIYVEHVNFFLDVYIMIVTVIQVLKRQDVAVNTDLAEGNLAEIRKRAAKRAEEMKN